MFSCLLSWEFRVALEILWMRRLLKPRTCRPRDLQSDSPKQSVCNCHPATAGVRSNIEAGKLKCLLIREEAGNSGLEFDEVISEDENPPDLRESSEDDLQDCQDRILIVGQAISIFTGGHGVDARARFDGRPRTWHPLCNLVT